MANFGHNRHHFLAEPKFVIPEVLGEPAELSTLFEHERTDAHSTQSTVTLTVKGWSRLCSHHLLPTTYSTTY